MLSMINPDTLSRYEMHSLAQNMSSKMSHERINPQHMMHEHMMDEGGMQDSPEIGKGVTIPGQGPKTQSNFFK